MFDNKITLINYEARFDMRKTEPTRRRQRRVDDDDDDGKEARVEEELWRSLQDDKKNVNDDLNS